MKLPTHLVCSRIQHAQIQWSLVVDNFSLKYVCKEYADHLIQNLERHYDKVLVD